MSKHKQPQPPIRLTKRGKVVVGIGAFIGLMLVLVALAGIVALISDAIY